MVHNIRGSFGNDSGFQPSLKVNKKKELIVGSMGVAEALKLGRVEKAGLVVTGILFVVNGFLVSAELALGVALGGLLVIANYLTIRLLVGALLGGTYRPGFSILIVLIKMLVLVALVVSLFLFTKVNIYGFFIGVTGVVIVIIGESFKASRYGAF